MYVYIRPICPPPTHPRAAGGHLPWILPYLLHHRTPGGKCTAEPVRGELGNGVGAACRTLLYTVFGGIASILPKILPVKIN